MSLDRMARLSFRRRRSYNLRNSLLESQIRPQMDVDTMDSDTSSEVGYISRIFCCICLLECIYCSLFLAGLGAGGLL